ncbi:MAG: ATP-binding protein [Anaerolineales bacterium]|nr:ATP-binding protein [Anaerolineales bacterium]
MFEEQQFDAPARHDSINLICEFVVNAAKKRGLAGDYLFHVELAVDEACTNIVEHAYEGKSGRIYIACGTEELDGESYFVVRLRDNGKPFDPGDIPPPYSKTNRQPQVGGLGVHFMRKMMDRIRFSFIEGWNDLYMYKKIGPEKA